MELISAAQDGHRLLYHYQSFRRGHKPDNSDSSIGYLEATLQNRAIHLSKPSNFNDPWDCRPWFDESELNDCPTEREKYLAWMVRTGQLDSEEAQEFREHPEQLSSYVTVTHRFLLRTIDDAFRVYCLTPEPLHPLMWSHYGDAHRGIALEFDAASPQMQYAYRVAYSRQYPRIRMYEESDYADLVPIYTKSDVWAYEQEYRLVGEERVSLLDAKSMRGVPMVYDSTLRLAEGVLTGVVLGSQCDAEAVLAVLDSYGTDLRVLQAELLTNEYGLRLRTIRS